MAKIGNIKIAPDLPPVDQFIQMLESKGIDTPKDGILMDGQIHRYNRAGASRDDTALAYYLTEDVDGPWGWHKDWSTGEVTPFRSTGSSRLTSEELEAKIKRQIQKIEEDTISRNLKAAKKADYIWNKYNEADSHPYLDVKKIKSHGCKLNDKGMLLIPKYNIDGEVVSLEFVDPEPVDGRFKKVSMRDGLSIGAFTMVGDDAFHDADTVYVAEGFATSATIFEITGKPAVATFSAQNMPTVANEIIEIVDGKKVIVVADNDEGGIGLVYAKDAAKILEADVILTPKIDGCKGTDVSDHYLADADTGWLTW